MKNQVKKILFVDDDPHIIEGLKRMLRSLRKDWTILFASGAEKALQVLSENSPVEIVVTDMKMPRTDGAQLLEKVKELYPEAIRIILSGEMGKDTSMRAIEVANQCIWKPCDAETLKIALIRAYSQKNYLVNRDLQKVISKVVSLPVLPANLERLKNTLRTGSPDIRTVMEIVQKDPSISSKLIQLVNSSFFGISKIISNAHQAVEILGMELLSTLVIENQLFKPFVNKLKGTFSPDRFWKHTLSVAHLSREIAIAENLQREIVDGAYVAGLLHNIGKLIVIDQMPEKAGKLIDPETGNWDYHKEQGVIGATQAAIGASLLGTWGIPDPVVEAVAFYKKPASFRGRDFRPLTALHIAENYLSEKFSPDTEYLRKVDDEKKIEFWNSVCNNWSKRQHGAA